MEISSEKLKDIYCIGIQVFGSAEEFQNWLKKPAFGLDKQNPEKFVMEI
jgi:uncharacterized protein (DUF2384 family)